MDRSTLYQYLYISTAPNLSREEVSAILDVSVRNNKEAGINGLLVYNGRNFLQLLEGEQARLNALMHRIHRDSRHTGIVMLSKGELETRACADWAMRQVRINDDPDARSQSLARELPTGLSEPIRAVISNFARLN